MIRLTPSVFLLLLMVSVMVSTQSHAESGLSGYWQHESEPIWIEMQPDTGKGVMLRNDNRPDRVGFLLVTDLVASGEPSEWSAQVFAAQLGEYRNATITLESDDLMAFTVKVGFIRRTVEWTRVKEVPPASDDE
ncbi:MAG: hypothetical protein O2876_04410 [Proteobacteria bacterium]|nr:hypothetical protein [Pseudomonadota bacterium]